MPTPTKAQTKAALGIALAIGEAIPTLALDALRGAGYGDGAITGAIPWALAHGLAGADEDEAVSLIVSRILLDDAQLDAGERIAVEPGSTLTGYW